MMFYSRKSKPADICNFYNNVESVFDHLIRRNKCYRIDNKFQNLISAGAEKVDIIYFSLSFNQSIYIQVGGNPVEDICDCALDLLEASKKALRNPADKKAIQIAVRS